MKFIPLGFAAKPAGPLVVTKDPCKCVGCKGDGKCGDKKEHKEAAMTGTTTPSFKRLLVAVDSSEQSGYAAAEGARLAKKLNADVVLMTVFRPDVGFTPELAFVEPDVRGSCIDGAEALLDGFAATMPELRVEKVIAEGDPATQIVETAGAHGADLIVMGTHHLGRVGKAVLGSVANDVARLAHCPVMTISHTR